MLLSNAGDISLTAIPQVMFFSFGFTQQERSFPPTRKGAFVCIKRLERAKIGMHQVTIDKA
jgi:hypothetical protein